MKCVKCKREATAKHNGYGWMCTFHYNKLIRELRIKRNYPVFLVWDYKKYGEICGCGQISLLKWSYCNRFQSLLIGI